MTQRKQEPSCSFSNACPRRDADVARVEVRGRGSGFGVGVRVAGCRLLKLQVGLCQCSVSGAIRHGIVVTPLTALCQCSVSGAIRMSKVEPRA